MENKLDLWTTFKSVESNDSSSNDTTIQSNTESSGERKRGPIKQMAGETIDEYIDRAFANMKDPHVQLK